MLTDILFDLDGTLTDSKEGIIKCTQYALKRLGQPRNTSDLIKSVNLIGLPIDLVFQKLLNSDDKILVEKAIGFYRERFSRIGFLENRIYPGIPKLLSFLYEKSYKMYVITVKPKVYAEKIVTHFSLDRWLIDVFGSSLEEREYSKTKLVSSTLVHLELSPGHTAMIGDKKEDILAGKSSGMITIGVTYGYGSEEEIIDSAPDHVCYTPSEIQMAITNH